VGDELLSDLAEDPSLRRLASRLIDHLGALGWNVVVHRIGSNAEGGCELQAWADGTRNETFRVESDRLYDAAFELSRLLGIESMDG
jgi:hypothetical protein